MDWAMCSARSGSAAAISSVRFRSAHRLPSEGLAPVLDWAACWAERCVPRFAARLHTWRHLPFVITKPYS